MTGGHFRLRYRKLASWSAGRTGCCAVWAYRTPWGALYGAWRLHKTRTRPVLPMPSWVEEASRQIDAARAAGYRFVTTEEGQPWRERPKTATGPIILNME